MKHLVIQSLHFNQLLQSFKEWLNANGYADGTIESFPVHLREYFFYLERNHITHITQATPRHLVDFIHYLKHRKNHLYGGALSASHINKCIVSINNFARFISQTTDYILDLAAKQLENDTDERIVLTTDEIRQLYDSTFEPYRIGGLAFGQRDRAMLAIFYGCGLRKEEGTRLNISDLDLIKKVVFVRKGKGYKQRYVPIAEKHADDLRSYIQEGRYWFMDDHAQSGYTMSVGKPSPPKLNTDKEALFLNQKGQRMCSFYRRLAVMRERTGIEKEFSTHTLRHSIATHLLQSGMPLEQISKFLGHSSLESTQIYTHIVNQLNHENRNPTDQTSLLLFS